MMTIIRLDNGNFEEVHPQRLLVPLIIGGFAANLIAPSIFLNDREPPNVLLVMILLGGLLSEPALLAIWAVLGIDPVSRRIGRILAVFMLGWFSWMAGMMLFAGKVPAEIAVAFAVTSILIEAVLIGAIWAYRWQTKQALCLGQAQAAGAMFQFTVKQIFGWTTAIAIALVVFQLLFRADENGGIPSTRRLLQVFGMGLLFAVLISVLVILCLQFCLGQRSKWVCFSLVVATMLFFPGSVVVTAMASERSRMSANSIANTFGWSFTFGTTLVAILILVLAMVRSVGFRLVPIGQQSDSIKDS